MKLYFFAQQELYVVLDEKFLLAIHHLPSYSESVHAKGPRAVRRIHILNADPLCYLGILLRREEFGWLHREGWFLRCKCTNMSKKVKE